MGYEHKILDTITNGWMPTKYNNNPLKVLNYLISSNEDKTSATTTREETTLKQNWIQCRVGERGITTPVHYDDGQNMIGMITGAKRYNLLPPNQCSKLSIFTDRDHSLFQHSTLNSGRMGNQQQQQQDEQQQGDNNNNNMLGALG